MSQTVIRISEETYRKVKEIAEKSGKSIREVIEEAIQLFLLGKEQAVDKDVKEIKNKWIIAKYSSKCSRCQKQINAGDMVFWIRVTYADNSVRSYLYCSECYLTSFDTSLAKKYLKIKELEATYRSLKKFCDSLAQQATELQNKVNLLQLEKDIEQFWFNFRSVFTNNPDVKVVNDFIMKLEEIIDRVKKLEAVMFAEAPLRIESRKRGKRVEETFYMSNGKKEL
jgi:predicted transcriptional regulator